MSDQKYDIGPSHIQSEAFNLPAVNPAILQSAQAGMGTIFYPYLSLYKFVFGCYSVPAVILP